jgi:hypothetical protein
MTDRSLCKYFRIPGKVQSTRSGEKWSDVFRWGLVIEEKCFRKLRTLRIFLK